MTINLNPDGTINGLSLINGEYPMICPNFIDINNAMRMKCININDHMNPDSWIEIEAEVLN